MSKALPETLRRALLALLAGLGPLAVCACECPVSPLDPQEELAAVGLIFEGTPVYSRLHFEGMGQVKIRTRWSITRVLYGPVLRTVEFDSPTGGSASCGFELRLGEQQALAARGSPQKGFATDSCTRSLGSRALSAATATASSPLRHPP